MKIAIFVFNSESVSLCLGFNTGQKPIIKLIDGQRYLTTCNEKDSTIFLLKEDLTVWTLTGDELFRVVDEAYHDYVFLDYSSSARMLLKRGYSTEDAAREINKHLCHIDAKVFTFKKENIGEMFDMFIPTYIESCKNAF